MKPLITRKGLAAIQIPNRIVLQAPHQNQVFSEISNYIVSRQLTDALELLERHGFVDGAAIFALRYLQPEEAA